MYLHAISPRQISLCNASQSTTNAAEYEILLDVILSQPRVGVSQLKQVEFELAKLLKP